jgi:hypothetical protein
MTQRRKRVVALVVGGAALACGAGAALVFSIRPPTDSGGGVASTTAPAALAASRPAVTQQAAATQPAPITQRTSLVTPRPFKLRPREPEARFVFTIPPIASGAGSLQIRISNMGDNSGDGGMYCILQNAAGESVRRWFNHRDKMFTYPVTPGTSWTVVLQDLDTSRDGNGGGIEIGVEPQ